MRQDDSFTDTTPSFGQGAHHGPAHVAIAPGRLAVVESSAHRVSLFPMVPTSGSTDPVALIGQDRFDTPVIRCFATSLNSPRAAAFTPDGTQLIVADTLNHRVNIYSSIPQELPSIAMNVHLGQPNAATCARNAGQPVASAESLNFPTGVWTDGTRLVVADSGNHRVLIWTSFPTED